MRRECEPHTVVWWGLHLATESGRRTESLYFGPGVTAYLEAGAPPSQSPRLTQGKFHVGHFHGNISRF